MQQNDVSLWNYNKSLDCMLFFAQRVNELLFHHTTDTYRLPAVSLLGLAEEFCTVYTDSQEGIINAKNLKHILDEFNDRLQKDPVAKKLLTDEYVERFSKSCGSWDVKNQFENINYIGRRLSNRAYYQVVTNIIKDLIVENKQKEEIDAMSVLWAREVIDCGYSADYVFRTLNEIFFRSAVDSLDSLDQFFGRFDFVSHRFDVFIGFSKDMSAAKVLFERIYMRDSKISVLSPHEVPQGIKTGNQKTILKFDRIQALDMYSAYEIAYDISTCVADSYDFFRHSRFTIRTYGQVVGENKSVITINPKDLLKYRVSSLSQLDSEKNADLLLSAQFSNPINRREIRKIVKIHNAAIKTENTNDSILSLWSILESLVDCNSTRAKQKQSFEKEGDEKVARNKSGEVFEMLAPFLKSTYIQKLVQTFMADVMRWDKSFFNKYIAKNGFGSNNLEHTFAFLAFKSNQSARNELFSRTELYPLLKSRTKTLSDQFHNVKNIKATIAHHEQRVRWHLYRIYRARNYIVHDATGDEELNQELLINLHSYVDTLVSKAVELIETSPYNDNISSIISDHKVEVSILDDILKKQENEDITEDNALKFLYYDYKQ